MSELTPQMLVHRDEAERLLRICYEAVDQAQAATRECAGVEVAKIRLDQANAAYDAHMTKADPTWHCCVTDPDLWSMFSDLYKEVNNFRPRGHYTRAEVKLEFDDLVAELERKEKERA